MGFSKVYEDFSNSARPAGVGPAVAAPSGSIGQFLGTHAWAVGGGLAASWLDDTVKDAAGLEKLVGKYGEDAVGAVIAAGAGFLLVKAASSDPRLPVVGWRMPSLAQFRMPINQFVAGMMGWWGPEFWGVAKMLYQRARDFVAGEGAQGGLEEAPSMDGNPAMMRDVFETMANSPDSLGKLFSGLAKSVAETTGADAADVEKGLREGFGHLHKAIA